MKGKRTVLEKTKFCIKSSFEESTQADTNVFLVKLFKRSYITYSSQLFGSTAGPVGCYGINGKVTNKDPINQINETTSLI